MSSTNNRILTIYNSRKNLLDILETLDYNITEYSGFSINEVDAMLKHNQLDMLLSKPNGDKAYIKYLCGAKPSSKMANPKAIGEIIEDLYINETVLEKKDTLILIMDGEPNSNLLERIKYYYDHSGYFIVVHNIERLLFNILEHKLVPPTSTINETEVAELLKKYNISSTKQLPEVSRFDPVSLAICLRPGQVCKIERSSPTALTCVYYRVCV
jgi:DNA-directed RNA polymerase subunit H (RpoH/RPB5)